MAVINRKQIEEMIYQVYDALDPSGTNSNKYHNLFSAMNEAEFEKFIKEFLANDDENFVLDIVEFEFNLSMENCEKAAKILDIPLMEYVYMPHLTMDKKNVVVSKEKCLVGYLNPKRTQQLLHKKNRLATSNERISSLTGQVTSDDKRARDSDIEAAMLISLGAEKILQEFHGPRADDLVMKRQMQSEISKKGYVLLEELDNDKKNKTTLNTVDAFLLSMGLKTDLVSSTYILPKTAEDLFD